MNRTAGILMPVFSLPAPHGIGDFGAAAREFADMLAANGAAHWQILPLTAGNGENGDSPYFSTSAFAVNPLLISLDDLCSRGLMKKREISGQPVFQAGIVDYDALRAWKMPLLHQAAARMKDGGFEEFCKAQAHWLDDFALFDVLRTELARPWYEWEAPLRDREEAALANLRESRRDAIRIRKVMQFLAFSQWGELRSHCAARSLSIVGDMPIYVAYDSADTWAHPHLFKLDENRSPTGVSGVPPDYFSATGQLWNNPVYDWAAHEKEGFVWWTGRLRHLFSLYDVVRIDHFRGLVQYWEVPAGEETAISGSWRDVPTYPFFDALRERLRPFPVIAEDLGIITDDVKAAMDHYGFPGMKILQFAFSDDNPDNAYLPHTYDENCIVYTGTHDNLPTLGWLNTAAGDHERRRMAEYTRKESAGEERVWDLIELALRSPAATAIIPLQDILTLDETARVNDPSRTEGNWRWRWDPASAPPEDAFARFRALGAQTGRFKTADT